MHLICKTQEIPANQVRGFASPKGNILLTAQDGWFLAYQDLCPHLQLSLGRVAQLEIELAHGYLVCAQHGALFDLRDGSCVWGPCAGSALIRVAIEVHSDGGIYLKE
jgi:nitrite reductase/ring-hydroxylating ferredoxin subunit